MLNIKSTEGEISLIFSEGENYYLVRRMLKPGKSKDSCSSQLFSLVITSGATSEANQSTPDMLTELLRRTLGSSSQ
ncbi:MAG: hypothetical protein LBD75_06005 [Candidatus Peribacteria bacterium]|jgi:hypothetical protein|nr:hypothetical protein [Candidatus Peribacteria bacterium]